MGCPVSIRGALREYDWGVHNGLSEWTGVTTDGPQAELWFGAHPSATSPLPEGGNLADLVAPEDVPLLTKFLAAASPLSLQVHPSAQLAAQIRSDPATRDLLADDAEKTEMLLALEDFLAMVGWRPIGEARTILEGAGASSEVLSSLERGDRAQAVRLLFGEHRLDATAEEWRNATADSDEITQQVMEAVVAKFGDDPGVAVAAMLQSYLLAPGDAAYLPAGVPHAYVHGRGIEVMTSSDNVLRMGLTPKTVSVEHALAAVVDTAAGEIIRAPQDGNYAPNGAPFRIKFVAEEAVLAPSGRYRIVLPVAGGVTVSGSETVMNVEAGGALVLLADCPDAAVKMTGRGAILSAGVVGRVEGQP